MKEELDGVWEILEHLQYVFLLCVANVCKMWSVTVLLICVVLLDAAVHGSISRMMDVVVVSNHFIDVLLHDFCTVLCMLMLLLMLLLLSSHYCLIFFYLSLHWF